MNIEEANKILADACGYPLDSFNYSEGFCDPEGEYILWTIQDPRCREIVREKFKISTWQDDDIPIDAMLYGKWWSSYKRPPKVFCKDTLAEAEIACCIAIAEEL